MTSTCSCIFYVVLFHTSLLAVIPEFSPILSISSFIKFIHTFIAISWFLSQAKLFDCPISENESVCVYRIGVIFSNLTFWIHTHCVGDQESMTIDVITVSVAFVSRPDSESRLRSTSYNTLVRNRHNAKFYSFTFSIKQCYILICSCTLVKMWYFPY